jgi:hypothetical protein
MSLFVTCLHVHQRRRSRHKIQKHAGVKTLSRLVHGPVVAIAPTNAAQKRAAFRGPFPLVNLAPYFPARCPKTLLCLVTCRTILYCTVLYSPCPPLSHGQSIKAAWVKPEGITTLCTVLTVNTSVHTTINKTIINLVGTTSCVQDSTRLHCIQGCVVQPVPCSCRSNPITSFLIIPPTHTNYRRPPCQVGRQPQVSQNVLDPIHILPSYPQSFTLQTRARTY